LSLKFCFVFVGKCNFTVAMVHTAGKVTCFKMMDGHVPICMSGGQTSQSCDIAYKDGMTCIKWPADIELTCVNDSDEMHKLNIEENKCAHDQESISCNGEYKSELRNSASTLSLSILLITTIVHWVSLWHY
ncbi:hypothetical protein cypCar_00012627, partial [Cyprinus carpio]